MTSLRRKRTNSATLSLTLLDKKEKEKEKKSESDRQKKVEKNRTRRCFVFQPASQPKLVVSVVFIRMSDLTKMSGQMFPDKCARIAWYANPREPRESPAKA